jgi:hypothetical protein
MEISKDLFLTDSRTPYLSLTLGSRDLSAHRLLSGLNASERDELHRTLADSSAALQEILRAALARIEPDKTTDSFGCGT